MRSTQRTPERNRLGASALIAAALLLAALAFSGCAPTREISWSPDTKSVVYQSDDALRIYDVDTRQSRELGGGAANALTPVWSPDGKLIAFYRVGPDEMTLALCTVDLSTGRVRTVASNVWRMPKAIADTIEVPPGKSRAEAEGEAQLVWLLIVEMAASISWSPDSAHLAWTGSSPRGFTLHMTDCASGASKPIIEAAGILSAVAWSPHGKRLGYALLPWELPPSSLPGDEARLREDAQSLWLYDFDSAERTKICDLPRNGLVSETRLQWSPDSGQIGFIRQSGDGLADGCIVDARPGANVRPELRGISATAAWSPDLSGVAFVEDREENEVVVIFRGMKPVTRKVIGVLHIPAVDIFASPDKAEGEESGLGSRYSMPEFSPDGRYVALRAGEKLSDLRIAAFPVQ